MLGAISVLCALLAISPANGDDSGKCDGEYEFEHDCQCLKFVIDPQVSWRSASTICRADGGRLVTIKDEVKQKFIAKKLNEICDRNGVWIGATYRREKDVFEWVDGTMVSDYFAWGTGEPDKGSVEGCVLMHRSDSWRWRDFSCSFASYSYICERDLPCKSDKLQPSQGLHTDEVIGIVVGGVVGVICFFGLIFFLINCCRAAVGRKRHHKPEVELREVETSGYQGENVHTSLPMIPPPEKASTSQQQENDLDRMSMKRRTPLLTANVVVTTPEVVPSPAKSATRRDTIKISNVPPPYDVVVGARRASNTSIDDNYIAANTNTQDIKHSADGINKL